MKKNINRRQFLQTSGLAIAGAAVVGTTGTLLLDPSVTWAAAKATLDDHTTKTLVVMCRQIYPHTVIEDAEYAKTVEGFTKKASTDPAFAQLLREGVATLDATAKGKWLEVKDEDKLQVLKSIADSPFFQTVQGTLVGAGGPYNLPTVWKKFGYEGSSWQLGGYLARGFDDIKWLPKE
jgi:TAT (twin-arginine translocation) pathway signal sequence